MIGRHETSTNPIASGSLTLLRHCGERIRTLLGEPSLPKNQKLGARPVWFQMQEEELPRSRYGLFQS